MDFDAQLRASKGGVPADVCDPWVAMVFPIGQDRIHAAPGKQLVRRANIGGWEPQLTPPLVPLHHSAGDRVEATKEGGHFIDASRLDPLPNDRAAHHPPLDADRLDNMDTKARFHAELLQEGNRPETPLAKGKVVPYVDFLHANSFQQDLFHERRRGLIRERMREGKTDNEIWLARLDQHQLLRGRRDQWRAVLRGQHFQWMGIERQDDGGTANLARPLVERAENRLMSQVDPIEIPDGEDRSRKRFRKSAKIGNDIHAAVPVSHVYTYIIQIQRCHLTIGCRCAQEKTPPHPHLPPPGEKQWLVVSG